MKYAQHFELEVEPKFPVDTATIAGFSSERSFPPFSEPAWLSNAASRFTTNY